MAYNKIVNLINEYLNENISSEVSENFSNMYMDTFFDLTNVLEKEITQDQFEILDSINLLCDSYERNEEIRNDDKNCIDEITLKNKVEHYYKLLLGKDI